MNQKVQTIPDNIKVELPSLFVTCVNDENLTPFEFPENNKTYIIKNVKYSTTSAIPMIQIIGIDIQKESMGKYWGFAIDRFIFTNLCPN